MSENPTPRITLLCLDVPQCMVYIEPWGTEFLLRTDDRFYVESNAFATGDVQIGFVEDGISLTFTSDDPIAITDRLGNDLPI